MILYVFMAVVLAIAGIVEVTQANGGLSEVQKLKAANYQLRLQLTQCQVTASNMVLTNEKQALENEFKSSLGATDKQEFDWNTLSLKDK